MYFRELPNPLCTYQLYKHFVTAVQNSESTKRIALMREVVQKLPPPHFRYISVNKTILQLILNTVLYENQKICVTYLK